MTDVEPTRTDDAPSREADVTILLLLDHERNRRLLARALSEEYAVVEGPSDAALETAFDACIVDARSFERHRESLVDEKRRAEPAFLPCVFLTDDDRSGPLPGEVWDLVDEVLTMPLEPAELAHRLENLLERRRLSLDLERRRARTEDRFEALFDTAPDPIVVTSSDGVISEVNESFASAVGESPEDLVGRSITDLGVSPSDTVERVLLRVVEPERDGADEPGAVRLGAEDDEALITELNADVVTELGVASERIGIFRDVTERTERETELREQNERLKQFASTIAHDLRNPLMIAKGHLGFARDGGEPEHFDTVARAHDRMEQLIDGILTLARRGQLVMDPEPVSLADAAGRAWRNVETGTATLSVESDVEVLADESRLCECFENLFANAVEHGGETVSVRVGAIDAAGESGFFVADDGPGIPPRDREDVFEAGYTETDSGTGFGLSIVRQIAEGHDWDVSVTESDEGGARFEILGTGRD